MLRFILPYNVSTELKNLNRFNLNIRSGKTRSIIIAILKLSGPLQSDVGRSLELEMGY